MTETTVSLLIFQTIIKQTLLDTDCIMTVGVQNTAAKTIQVLVKIVK